MFFKVIVVFGLLACSHAQTTFLDYLECPFPEGQLGQGKTECETYTACEWNAEYSMCHMIRQRDYGYLVLDEDVPTENGFMASLRHQVATNETMFKADIENLTLHVIYHSESHLQIKIYDADKPRYEVPVPFVLPYSNLTAPTSYRVEIPGRGNRLVINVVRPNGNLIFQSAGPLTFEDQFIQFTTILQSTYLYGFGENNHDNFRHSFEPRRTQAIFTRDQNTLYPDVNSYGAHPYHMVMEDDDGTSHSVLFVNSNAMEYSTFYIDGNYTPALTYRTIGGIIDLHFFMGPTPEDLNQQYMSMIGHPAFPPYSAFGYHLSRWGYADTDEIRDLRNRMQSNNIPMDVQTVDIDYMDERRDFTVDSTNWGDLSALISELHTDNIRTTLILDPALSTNFSSYPPGLRGDIADAYIHWSDLAYVPPNQPSGASDNLVGNVWPPEPTFFPDFLKSSTHDWWKEEIRMMDDTLNFDYLWIDMNEPANFDTNMNNTDALQCPTNKWDDPPYPTLAARGPDNVSGRLSDKTICMTSVQLLDGVEHMHYDVHSLYGWSQAEATYNAISALNPGKRPFVLSRSTYPGSGKYAIHWLGDNFSDWDQMRKSIIGLFEFNMFGIPFVGADVCGFGGDATEELCIRWTQLGAFYPFNRNHNAIGSRAQDPAQAEWPTLISVASEYISLRYRYNPFLYTIMQKSSQKGISLIRPILNVFPDDVLARDVDDQFFWGDTIMVAPVLTQNTNSRDVYFPMGVWYDLVIGIEVSSSGQETLEIDAPLEVIPVFVRGGRILPWQVPGETLTDSRLNPFGLTVAIAADKTAEGRLYWDDGETLYDSPIEAYGAVLTYTNNQLTLSVMHGNDIVGNLVLNTVYFYGYHEGTAPSAEVNGEPATATYHPDTTVLEVTFSAPLNSDISLILTN